MALINKQKQFCREYVKDYNATQAAIRAGYSEKTASVQGSRLLKKTEILKEIRINQKELLKSSCLSEEKIINNLQDVLNHCMSAVPVMTWDYNKHEWVETGTYEFDSKGALEAIKMLGLHLGMFNKKDNNSNINDNSKDFKALINSINNKAAEVWIDEDKA